MKDFYGTVIDPITFTDGTLAKLGDVIRWHCDDNEEVKTWVFTGIYKSNKVIYLGGGIDFGMGIGGEMSVQEVIKQANNNDSYNQGINKIGAASDMARIICNFNKAN